MSKQSELVPQSAQQPAHQEQVGGFGAVLNNAIAANLGVEGIREIATLVRQERADRAAHDFSAALATFQKDCPPILRASTAAIVSKSGARFGYRYAELDEIARTVGPMLHGNGFSYSWDSKVDGSTLSCTCTLRHKDGHSEHASFACPTESKAGMSEAQKVASALTFAKRVIGSTRKERAPSLSII